MAGITDIITLGIGPHSDIPHLVLTGLSPGVEPPFQDVELGTVQIGIPIAIPANSARALPAYATKITWSGTDGSLSFSLDGDNFAIVDTTTGFQSKSLKINAVFVKANVDIILIALREKL